MNLDAKIKNEEMWKVWHNLDLNRKPIWYQKVVFYNHNKKNVHYLCTYHSSNALQLVSACMSAYKTLIYWSNLKFAQIIFSESFSGCSARTPQNNFHSSAMLEPSVARLINYTVTYNIDEIIKRLPWETVSAMFYKNQW